MRYWLVLLFFLGAMDNFGQQQIPDFDFNPAIDSPKYSKKTTALIGVDASHNNLHKLGGGFEPFAKLLRSDGYQLSPVTKVTPDVLNSLNTLVIVNPLHESNVGNWKRPIKNAFTEDEIQTIKDWVTDGGSLMVIADHMPYAGAAQSLANAFDFEYRDGFVMSENEAWPPETYSKRNGTLNKTVATQNIDSIAGFTGSGLIAPKDAIIIASFPESHKLFLPEVAWQFEEHTKIKDTKNLSMGAIMRVGKGKVAFFTEAAMFTAQIVKGKIKVGFNSPEAPQNMHFVLNVMHWLDSGRTQKIEDQQSREMQIVKRLLDRQANYYESNEMIKVAKCYTIDAIFYEPTGREIIGIKSIIAYWERIKGAAVSWETEIQDVEEIGDQVLAICQFKLKYMRGEKVVIAKSKAMLTFKKEAGEYKIFRDFYMPIN
ncbi:MAG: DUF4440 domain-containing protein [Bacteroidota bacterium]